MHAINKQVKIFQWNILSHPTLFVCSRHPGKGSTRGHGWDHQNVPGTEGRGVGTHRVCVGAVCAEGQGDGRIEDAELADHLLHAADGALLVRVCKLDHQAGRGTLGEERIGASLRREGRLRLTSRVANGTSAPHQINKTSIIYLCICCTCRSSA